MSLLNVIDARVLSGLSFAPAVSNTIVGSVRWAIGDETFLCQVR